MQKKIQKMFFDILIIALELVVLNTRFYWEREHFSSAVNMLTNSLKISDITQKKLFELIFFHTDQKIRQKYCHAALESVSDPLRCCLTIGVLTRGFLGI